MAGHILYGSRAPARSSSYYPYPPRIAMIAIAGVLKSSIELLLYEYIIAILVAIHAVIEEDASRLIEQRRMNSQ